MKCEIKYQDKTDKALDFCLERLPLDITEKIKEHLKASPYKAINEIRLHKNSYISLIADSKNVKTSIYLTNDDIKRVYEALCDMSIYAHISTIKQGYICIGNGIRAGICGKAIIENNEIIAVDDISSINIRIPQSIVNASSFLYKILNDNSFNCSIILYSSPGVGKTTILRDLISKISKNSIRYAVIDTKNELSAFIENYENGDFFSLYPKGMAIELATKNMTPQIIICDEISSQNEADEIILSVNSGVNLIATTHANSFDELLSKKIFKELLSSNIFKYAIGVKRDYGKSSYQFTLNELK